MILSTYICGQQEGIFTEFKYADGSISSSGFLVDGRPDGFWRTYYPGGIIKSEGKRTNFELDSVWTFFNTIGLVSERITYTEGKRNGDTELYKAGQLNQRCQYVLDTLQGICQEYENELLTQEIPFDQGLQEGKGYAFDKKGNITSILFFKSGFLRRKEVLNRQDKIGRKQGLWKEFYEDRSVKSEGTYVDDLKHGLFKTYDNKGEVLSMDKYSLGVLDEDAAETTVVDIRNEYFSDGTIQSSGSFVEGEKHGVHRDYDKEGTIIASRVYEYGTEVAQGIIGKSGTLEGEWEERYENGELKEAGTYENGLRTDKWKFYSEEGKLIQSGSFRKGKPHGEWKWYYRDATLRREENYRNGREDGMSVEYNNAGAIVSKGEYIDGLKEGEWYYHIGDHVIKGSYNQGEKDGDWLGIYDNGKTQFKGSFQSGYAKGKHKFFYSTGQLKQDGKYSSGRRDGDWRHWGEDGEILLRSTFEAGIERRIEGIKILPTFEELEID